MTGGSDPQGGGSDPPGGGSDPPGGGSDPPDEGYRYNVDGDLVPARAATVSASDAGLRFGRAAVRRMRAYGGSVFEFEAHLDRLERTCSALAVTPPDRGTLRERVADTLAANDLADAHVELTVAAGAAGSPDLAPGPDPGVEPVPGTVVVAVEAAPRGGRERTAHVDPATVTTGERRVPPPASVPPELSVGARLPELLSAVAAPADADEVLLLDVEGRIARGARSDVCFVDGRGLHAPDPRAGPVGPGVTRRAVLEYARGVDVPVRVDAYGLDDLRRAEEAFLVSPRWEVRPIAAVDGATVGGGPVTDLLRMAFRNRVEAAHY